ncbi:STAS domain-containing protein [Aureimonas ureilytica]|uniref:STAS domain-containing protein n=1 Tax=Aureimonas ureilytica TaxID=401562 RepID=UPI003CE858AA
MGSKTPTTGTPAPQDDLVVALPPEILAMMAASDASLTATQDAEAAEADDAAAFSAESGEVDATDELASPPASDAAEDPVEGASDETMLVATGNADEMTDAADLGDADPSEPAELAGTIEEDAPPADLDAQMALLLASVGALPAGAEAPEASAPVALPARPAENEALLSLPAVLDLTAAGALHAALLNHRGTPLALDAGEVKRLGGQCLQLLLSADRTWAADGVSIRLQGASEAFDRDLGFMGLSRDDLFQRTAA